MKQFAADQSELDLDPAVGEIYLQRHQCKTALFRLADQSTYLDFMQQQFSGPLGLVRPRSPLRIWTDMQIMKPDLAVIDPRETVLKRYFMTADRLDLGADQDDPGLVSLFDKIIVIGLAI